jgi:hypothetical protein
MRRSLVCFYCGQQQAVTGEGLMRVYLLVTWGADKIGAHKAMADR